MTWPRYGQAVGDLTLRSVSGGDISAPDLHAVLLLRSDVFIVEQACPYPDIDGRDVLPSTIHLWLATADGEVASYVRVLAEPGGGHRIGRVVTSPKHRGQALASRLIDGVLEWADRPTVLDAQSHLVGLYAKHGFVVDGDEYVEDGIPHTPMRLA
jgi:ElaA protein